MVSWNDASRDGVVERLARLRASVVVGESPTRRARARRSGGETSWLSIGAASAMVGGRDARAVEETTSATLTDIGEIGIGTWSWGNTAVWVRPRGRATKGFGCVRAPREARRLQGDLTGSIEPMIARRRR